MYIKSVGSNMLNIFYKGETQLSRNKHFKQKNKDNTVNFNEAVKAKLRETKLIPKSLNQEKYIMSLLDCQRDIVIAYGPAGTGKTYLAAQAAVRCLRHGNCERIILTRPAVGVEDEKHGFLPGTLEEKMTPWTRPLLDVIREYYTPFEIEKMLANQTIEISPLAFMRGRNFRDSFIIFDEAQNCTSNQMKMVLTRISSGSKIVVTGDLDQKDKKFDHDNGLDDFIKRVNNSTRISINELDARDVQRHPVVTEVLKLYR